MLTIVLKRLGEAVGLFLAISVIIFFLGAVVPGDAALALAGSNDSTPERLAALRAQLGLDQPIPVRYWEWLSGAVRGDFGTSVISGRSIAGEIAHTLPVTLELSVLGMVGALLIGVPVGVYAASHPDSLLDRLLRGSTLVMLSVPNFALGVILVLVGAKYAPVLYSSFYVAPTENLVENLRVLILPSLAVALPTSGQIAQMTRSAMVESMTEQFVTTARAKGVRRWRIHYIHALKSAMPPVVTLTGLVFGSLIGGLMLVEQIFNLPGLGRAIVAAIGQRDYQLVVAGTMVIAAVYVLVNLIVDLLYPILDPRQRR